MQKKVWAVTMSRTELGKRLRGGVRETSDTPCFQRTQIYDGSER